MPAPINTHMPEFAQGVAALPNACVLVVDTGLRNLKSAAVSMKRDTITANEESHAIVNFTEGSPKITIKVYKGGTASGTIGDSACNVAWMAVGE